MSIEASQENLQENLSADLSGLTKDEARGVTFDIDLDEESGSDAESGPEPEWIKNHPLNNKEVYNNQLEVEDIFADGIEYIVNNCFEWSDAFDWVKKGIIKAIHESSLIDMFKISKNKDIKLILTEKSLGSVLYNIRRNSPRLDGLLKLYNSDTLAKKMANEDPFEFDAIVYPVSLERSFLNLVMKEMIRIVRSKLKNKGYKIYGDMNKEVDKFFK